MPNLARQPRSQARLLPLVAATYAFNAAFARMKPMWVNRSDDMIKRAGQMKEIHVVASAMKAVSAWHMSATLQTCREACGGMVRVAVSCCQCRHAPNALRVESRTRGSSLTTASAS